MIYLHMKNVCFDTSDVVCVCYVWVCVVGVCEKRGERRKN